MVAASAVPISEKVTARHSLCDPSVKAEATTIPAIKSQPADMKRLRMRRSVSDTSVARTSTAIAE